MFYPLEGRVELAVEPKGSLILVTELKKRVPVWHFKLFSFFAVVIWFNYLSNFLQLNMFPI
jgi:type VI protein secretion system component VasF